MKKDDLKMHAAKIFVALGGISTVAASCNKDVLSCGMESFTSDEDEGISLLPIDLMVSENVNIQGMVDFAKDVIASNELQQQFNANPTAVLEQYHISQFDARSPQIQVLFAMGDSEVLSAIRKNDFDAYLNIMEKKQYLQSDMIKKIKKQMEQGISIDQTKAVLQTEDCIVGVPVILFVAAAIVIVVAIEVGIAIDLGVTVRGAESLTKSSLKEITGYNLDASSIIHDDAITIYVDKSKSLKTIEIGEEEYVTEIREKIASLDCINDIDEEEVFQITCGTIEHLLNEK